MDNSNTPMCYNCKEKVVYDKELRKHSDDEVKFNIDFNTDYCIFCARYSCKKCFNNGFF